MSDLVLDASALVLAVAGKSPGSTSLRERIRASTSHAPHLIDAEAGNVLRRQELAGAIAPATALTALHALSDFIDHRHPHTGSLAEAAWRLRGSVTFYDALYLALGRALRTQVVTCDARLSRAPNLPCEVELVE